MALQCKMLPFFSIRSWIPNCCNCTRCCWRWWLCDEDSSFVVQTQTISSFIYQISKNLQAEVRNCLFKSTQLNLLCVHRLRKQLCATSNMHIDMCIGIFHVSFLKINRQGSLKHCLHKVCWMICWTQSRRNEKGRTHTNEIYKKFQCNLTFCSRDLHTANTYTHGFILHRFFNKRMKI